MNGLSNRSSSVDVEQTPLREIMSARVVTIKPEETAGEAWKRMRRRGIRHLVVMDAGRLAGIISERNLGGRAGAGARAGRKVQDMMTPQVASAGPETTVRQAADLMRKRLIGSLPVLDGDRLVGIVTATDVFDALGDGASKSISRAERQLLRAPSSSKRLGGQPVPDRRSAGARELPSSKRRADQAGASPIPANIRSAGIDFDDDDREYIRQSLNRKLGKYAGAIERVSVRVRDVNGPRGGVDRVCRIKVALRGAPSILHQNQSASLKTAINGAVAGVERAVRRTVERKTQSPIRRRRGAPASRR